MRLPSPLVAYRRWRFRRRWHRLIRAAKELADVIEAFDAPTKDVIKAMAERGLPPWCLV